MPPVCRCSSGWLSLVCIIKRRGVELEKEREGEGRKGEREAREMRGEESGEAEERRRMLQRKGKREERDRGRERSVTGKKKGKKIRERARA